MEHSINGLVNIIKTKLSNIALFMKSGNAARYHLKNVEALPSSPLKGKTIIFLGSSVTYGSASLGTSFVEYIGRRNGVRTIKEAVSGTTLVTDGDDNGNSYIPRMKTIDPNIKADCFVCQLSTNDASQEKELGTISDSFDMNFFDTNTIAGAIEYIIAYARQTWNCPVVFFTNTKYNSIYYGKMVNLLFEIQRKWDIGIIDLWNNTELNNINQGTHNLYMADDIHPTQAGYLKWWTPAMEAYLYEFLK